MIKKWTVLAEKDVSPSHWFSVVQHTVKLPSGKIINDFFIGKLGNVAMVLPFTTRNEIVLVKQYKHGTGEVMIELPAGIQCQNKTIEETALKELEEETGIEATSDQLISLGKISNNPTKTNHITFGFIARNLNIKAKQSLDLTEDIELLKVSPKEVLKMVASGEIWVGDTVAFIMKANMIYPNLFR